MVTEPPHVVSTYLIGSRLAEAIVVKLSLHFAHTLTNQRSLFTGSSGRFHHAVTMSSTFDYLCG